MSTRRFLTLSISLGLLLQLALSSQATTKDHLPYPTDPIWTRWDAQRYDLADDGQSIWIAAAGGIIRWDKQTSTAHYITTLDGLPHNDVFTVAVDPDGNRWFGGDAGLSRLDPAGVWTHYDADNSDLPDDPIDAIAVAADGTLWLSHGLPDGAVSQRQPDGPITWYPNLETAVVQAYEQIKETLNANDMWAVFGDEVWVGYRVFDGMTWQERLPPNADASDPIVRAAGNAVYTLVPGDDDVFVWNGANWASYHLYSSIHSAGVTLAVGPDDSAWVAWFAKEGYYVEGGYGISRLPEEPGEVQMEHYVSSASAPPDALLATAEGLWGVGPGWLLHPDWSVSRGEDGPASRFVDRVVLSTAGTLFVQSGPFVQTVEDRGTTILNDDRWAIAEHVAQNVTAVERLPDGGLWVAGYDNTRIYFDDTYRYHQGAWLSFPLSIEFPVYDIFAEDARITWFAYANNGSVVARGVKRLDDGGTPADRSDDVWTDYPINSPGRLQHLAVDGLGRIWAAGDADLYLHDGNAWQPYFSDESGSQICDMVPLDDGTLILQRSYSCERPFNYVPNYLVIHPDGLSEQTALDDLVQEEFERIVNTPHRNRLWTVAPDGAVWYLFNAYPESIARYDGAHTTTFDLPFEYYDYQGGPLEVDENNHVWLVNDGLLWRLSPTPGFVVDPQAWLLSPGSSRQRTLTVHSIDGYSGAVTLALEALPPGISAAFQPNPLAAGETTQLTLTVDPTVAPGTYYTTLVATDGALTRTAVNTIIIAPTVHDLYAPLAARPGS